MSTLQIQTPRVFAPLLQPARYKGAHGGRGSGKSHFFGESLVERALLEPGLSAVCIRQVQHTLKQSSKRLIENKIAKLGVASEFEILDAEIRTPGGRGVPRGVIIFNGMQNHTAESIKSLEDFRIAWADEAQSLSQSSLDILRPTLRNDAELWFSWNPRDQKDPVDALLRGEERPPRSVVVEANWNDNPWFPDDLRQEMEYDRRRDPDKYAWVWGGKYRTISEARVFKNWRIEELKIPPGLRPFFGADWGFSVDPTVLVRCWIWGRTLYVDREVYRVGCEIDRTPALFDTIADDRVPRPRDWPIVADSSHPQTISYMQRNGYAKIEPARKGPGSVEEGVEFLKSFDIVVHPDCRHTSDELTLYSWKVDKHTEEILPELADDHNHVIDALRYAAEKQRRGHVPIVTPFVHSVPRQQF